MPAPFNNKWFEARARLEKVKKLLPSEDKRKIAAFNVLRDRFYHDFWVETCQTYDAGLEDIGYGFYRIRKGDRYTYVRRSDVMLDDFLSLKIAGNKPLTHKLLKNYGHPEPRYAEFTLSSLDKAREFMHRLNGPAVVKPSRDTGAGAGVTTKIRTDRQLVNAAIRATANCPDMLIEEEVEGQSFRLLYLGGKYIDAVRRESPAVIGNGHSTIRELIEKENQSRLDSDPVNAVNPLLIDLECTLHLRESNLKTGYVPPDKKRVIVKTVVNQNNAQENFNIREKVHPSIVRLGSKLVSALNLELAGVDIIAPDLATPLEESGGVVNEVNTTPGLHHHYLLANPDQRAGVGELLLDYLLFMRPARYESAPFKSGINN